ncbi:uncharacterized protein Mb2734-like [Impatiens glandulifera]|uniref:uncharacterized protein Mb2734-like n=1 Tax=Impatiens glandulifera TaxID=253017 RepID=UPI001FB081D8|nr:uncharacterized protein Mb2734-like [Impatiens glandulifera]
MAKCFSFMSFQDKLYRFSFGYSGLKSSVTDLGDGTVIHCWIPKMTKPRKPNLLLIHGIGANAMWQFNEFIGPLTNRFNLYVPQLLFFGDSYTTRPERSEVFQAQCIMRAMESYGVNKMMIVGLSYGGFVGYSMAAQFPSAVDRLVIAASGICLEEKDMEDGMFKVSSVEEAITILLPQTPAKMRELLKLTFYQPPKIPNCLLNDFINVMCTEYHQERKELIEALHKDRKLADLPKIHQPTFIIWGEKDKVFPIELGHRLKRHLGENIAEMVIIKNAGHAINVEGSKEMFKHMKRFLYQSLSSTHP